MWRGIRGLMGMDEEGTLERLKALRRELLDPKIAEHHGRIVKTTGDGMLVGLRASSTRSDAQSRHSKQSLMS
jgi:adenylate cyclase